MNGLFKPITADKALATSTIHIFIYITVFYQRAKPMNSCIRSSVASRRVSEDTWEELPVPLNCNALTAPFSRVIL